MRDQFRHPPPEARIMMRWWWFGPAVTKPELRRELEVMKSAGIGGVELQPVYPLELDDAARGIHNDAYLSPAFLDNVRFAATTARDLGMRIDVTLGSGWPYGGPQTDITHAAAQLRCDKVRAAAGAHWVTLPWLENGEAFIAAFLEQNGRRLTDIRAGRVWFEADTVGPQTILFFISSRSGQQVKRASVGAEGFVLDHFDAKAVQHHLEHVANRLLTAFANRPPYSVFSDSLEVVGTDWTPRFLQEFQQRRGYDLTDHLPDLVSDRPSSNASAIRHDWAQTLTELSEDHYLKPIAVWAHEHHTKFRSQTYGEPPVYLSSNDLVDLPEGEAGPQWRTFSTARWASSASHLYGRPVTSTETWTWLHSPAFRATPLDMKAEADLHFIQGINQLVGHGWPYSPPDASEPGQRFYAAASFNDHNPWFQVMPEICLYLQRLSYLLRQGEPVRDVAIYLPTDDALAASKLGHVSIDRQMSTLLGLHLIPAVLDAGYTFDFIDDRAIETRGIPYELVILPHVERIAAGTLHRLQQYIDHGGVALATRRLPSLSPGFADADDKTEQVKDLAGKIFGAADSKSKLVADEDRLQDELHKLVRPDIAVNADVASKLGFTHRAGRGFDIYFLANTSNQQIKTPLSLRADERILEEWDPLTGTSMQVGTGRETLLELEPYESRIFVLTNDEAPKALEALPSLAREISLQENWTANFSRIGVKETGIALHSWTDSAATRFFSGECTYERTVELPVRPGSAVLDFGPGQKVDPPKATGVPGMRALLDGPVRESAVVFVNGKKAGAVWHPPYRLEVAPLLHPGINQLRIVVANTAINEITGRSLPDYRLLNLRYGQRFIPQGFDGLEPLPSGILGKLSLRLSAQ